MKRRRGRRRKKLLDDLKDRRGYSHLKEEALDRTMWRNRFRGSFGPVVRQNTEWMDSFVWPLFHFCISERNLICLIRKEVLINEGNWSRGCDVDTGREIEFHS